MIFPYFLLIQLLIDLCKRLQGFARFKDTRALVPRIFVDCWV